MECYSFLPPTEIPTESQFQSIFTIAMRVSRPRICHVLHSLQTGGAELLACDFGRKHVDCFDSVYVCLDDAGDLASLMVSEGFQVHVLGRKPGFDFSLLRKLYKVLKSTSIDLIHAHQYAPFFYSSLSRGFSSVHPPILFTEHGRLHPDFRRLKRCLMNQLLLKPSDKVVAVGNSVKKALVENEWIPSSRIRVVYNGISIEKFKVLGTVEERVDIRRREGIPLGIPVIVQVARLNAIKDHLTAVRAMKLVASEIPNALLLIVGEGSERRSIEDEVMKLEMNHNVRLLGNRHDVASLLAASDVFMLSSVSEGIPLTMIEAMLSGVPCVATNVGGIPEVISSGDTGLLVNPKDARELAESALSLLRNKEFASKIAQAARVVACEKFSDVGMHSAYSGLYESMLK